MEKPHYFSAGLAVRETKSTLLKKFNYHSLTAGVLRFESRTLKPTGYEHFDYGQSLADYGRPVRLINSGGWVLARDIVNSKAVDAMGGYPLFCCGDWSRLADDLKFLSESLVSLMVVPGPFERVSKEGLGSLFDQVIHFKDHFVADLSQPIDGIVKPSHRRTVRRALKKVSVLRCLRPTEYLDTWIDLFENLKARHRISGLRAFSRRAFELQLTIPGMVMFEAKVDGMTVGLDLWYVQGDVAYGHLVAFNEIGYRHRASYATKWFLLHYFSDKVRWIDFGAGAGLSNAKDGLTKFKEGWSTETRPVYLCGKILQPDVYEELTRQAGVGKTSYFPAYRAGEFA